MLITDQDVTMDDGDTDAAQILYGRDAFKCSDSWSNSSSISSSCAHNDAHLTNALYARFRLNIHQRDGLKHGPKSPNIVMERDGTEIRSLTIKFWFIAMRDNCKMYSLGLRYSSNTVAHMNRGTDDNQNSSEFAFQQVFVYARAFSIIRQSRRHLKRVMK